MVHHQFHTIVLCRTPFTTLTEVYSVYDMILDYENINILHKSINLFASKSINL